MSLIDKDYSTRNKLTIKKWANSLINSYREMGEMDRQFAN